MTFQRKLLLGFSLMVLPAPYDAEQAIGMPVPYFFSRHIREFSK